MLFDLKRSLFLTKYHIQIKLAIVIIMLKSIFEDAPIVCNAGKIDSKKSPIP